MFTIIFAFTFAYIVLALCKFVGDRLNNRKTNNPIEVIDIIKTVDTIMDKPIYRSVGCAAIDYSLMNCDQLRSLCTEQNIKWRNAHGRNKHMKKAEMVLALS